MNHSSPWRVSPQPKGNMLPHGSFLAIYEELLEMTRSKSHISPWEQKAGADGGVHSHPWATFEIVQSLGASHWRGRAPCAGQPAPLLQDLLLFAWCSSGRDQRNQHPVLPQYYRSSPTVQSKHLFSLFWFSQTHRNILRNPASGLIIYFVCLVL